MHLNFWDASARDPSESYANEDVEVIDPEWDEQDEEMLLDCVLGSRQQGASS